MQPLRVVCASACLIGLVSAPMAHAEEGEFQLGLGTPFLGYTSTTLEGDNDFESTTSGVRWGIRHEVFAELGYGITPNLLVGGLLKLGGSSMSTEIEGVDDEIDSGNFDFLLGPKLDYVLMPGDKVQPFVGGVIGYLSFTETNGDTDNTVSGFQFMARGGVRVFPGKEFSIDPWLGLSYFTGGWEQENDAGDSDGDASGFELMVNLTLSGWM